jgi:hypothetical protein
MNRPTFLEGALVALVAALAASVLDTVLCLGLRGAPAPAPTLALALTVASLGLGYLLYLVGRRGARAGRVLLALAWLPLTATAFVLLPTVWGQVLVQLGLVWVARVWLFHGTPFAALLDLGLVASGTAAALWAGVHSGSLFLVVWSLFLVQALFGSISSRPGPAPGLNNAPGAPPDPFDLAMRAAEGALRRLDNHS